MENDHIETNRDISRKHPPLASPWSRFFARRFDYTWISVTFLYLISFLHPDLSNDIYEKVKDAPLMEVFLWGAALSISWFFLVYMVDFFIYCLIGNTPGKIILGLKITRKGRALSPSEYLKRSIGVFIYGELLNIIIVSLAANINQYFEVKKTGAATYDRKSRDEVLDSSPKGEKWWRLALLIIAIVILNVLP